MMDSVEVHARIIDQGEPDRRIQQIQDLALALANELNRAVPDGRYKSLAMTAIEESLLWTKRAAR